MFPAPKLNTGGRIPAQVELGILAQESNLWQAESGAIPGQMGSPLAAVDGFYGHQTGGSLSDYWRIHWQESDCGYGVGQVTDGMRMAGHEKDGETALSPEKQRAIAIDYTTNIAASLYILADKWNEVHEADQKVAVNNDDPAKPENWFTAVWNYNLGFNPRSDESTNGNWGLGWYNNPANPVYPPTRLAFMNTDLDPEAAKDAAKPQYWPYEEKVMGWAAWSIDTGHSYATSGRQDWPGDSGFSSAGFYPAYWNGTLGTVIDQASAKYRRAHVSPPLDAFCNTKNNCDTANPPDCPDATCYTQYWWNESNVTWKSDCATSCGFEHIKYLTLVSEPGRGYRLQYGTPVCSGEPSGAKVVESVPQGTDTWSDCGITTTDGSFQFTFYPDPAATGPGLGQYDAKADLHQIGGGYNGHFWFTHARDTDHLGGDDGRMTILGDWKLNSALSGRQAKVYVHIPDTGAQVSNASYKIITPFGAVTKTIDQGAHNNSWVSLGAYNFNDQAPEVQLTNSTSDGAADKDVAYDAVAFVPGDYDGLNAVTFPEADPNAPDIDFVATQDAKEVSTTSSLVPSPLSSTPGKESCSTGSDGATMCAAYKPLEETNTKSAKSPGAAKSTLAAAAGPVSWCQNVNGAALQTRTEGCLRGLLVLTATRDGAPIGNATMKVIQEISLNPKSNQFTTWTEVSLVNMTGISSTTLTSFDEECWTTTACTESNGTWTGSTTWTAGDPHVATRTNTYSWNTVSGGEDLLNLTWNSIWSTPDATVEAVPKWSNNAFDVRCDNKVGGNTGCVFPKYTPTLQLNTRKYPAAAAYYWVLMEKLASHPGSEKYNKPLHRLADDTIATDNRNKMCLLAVAEWNPNPNADGTSCDEYPFAKSRESGGMTLTSGKYCVQTYAHKQSDGTWMLELDNNYPLPTWGEICGRAAVPAKQNTDAGGDLGRFTSEIRLLDDDPYFVQTGFEYCDINSVCNIS